MSGHRPDGPDLEHESYLVSGSEKIPDFTNYILKTWPNWEILPRAAPG